MIKPKFLDKLVVTHRDEVRLGMINGNWMKIHANLPGLSEAEVAKLIVLEINGRRSLTVLDRLMTRFNALRRDREREELIDVLSKSQGKQD